MAYLMSTLSEWWWYSPDRCPQKGVLIRLQTG